jgi:tetratricopeptide (TPR) repeat protein
MKTPAAADLQRWSDEVARDPNSLAFLPLARAYRRQGAHDAALRLCLRGLEAHAHHPEAHALLALLYLDGGDCARAADEWAIVLRLDPANFEALRGLGFCYLDGGDLAQARHHLERAALARPGEPAVRDALRLVRERIDDAAERAGFERAAARAAASAQPPAPADDRVSAAPPSERDVVLSPIPAPAAGVSAGTNGTGYHSPDPYRLFDAFLAGGPLLGAVLIDARGLVLGGRIDGAEDAGRAGGPDAEVLGAMVSSAVAEVARTVLHLEMGCWQGVLLETDEALMHLAPADADSVVVLAAQRDAPSGWVLRTAAQAGAVARQFLGGQA